MSFLDYRYWPVKDLELAPAEMLLMFTPGKTARLFTSDAPWRCSNWLVIQQEPEFADVDCSTALLLWCHQLTIAFWMVKGQWKEICLRKGTFVYFAVNPTACQAHNRQNRRHQFFLNL